MNRQRIRLWDLPTRIFHWSLAALVIAAFISGLIGGKAIDLHGRIGLAILGLLAFRIVWGVAGSTYARFAQFAPTPSRIVACLRGQWHGIGHNPLGALSVFALLALLGVQTLSGLMANDDIAFSGPLYPLIDKALSDQLSSLHRQLSNLLMALVVLHIAAIGFYAHVKKDNLIKPMLTGWKEDAPATARSASGGSRMALAAALLIALAAVYGGSGIWIPSPPPQAVPAAPDW